MKYKVILIIFILALISSLALILTPPEKICDGTCTSDEKAKYDSFFGIKNAYFGLFIFTFLSTITFFYIRKPHKYKKKIINIGIIFGALIALYFIYIQAFILKEFCKYCLIVDSGMLINLFLIIPKKIKEGKKK